MTKPTLTSWLKGNVLIILLTGVLAWIAVQQTEMQHMMQSMVDKIDDRCKAVENRILDLEAKQVYDRVEIEAIKTELIYQRQWIDVFHESKPRGGEKLKDTDIVENVTKNKINKEDK